MKRHNALWGQRAVGAGLTALLALSGCSVKGVYTIDERALETVLARSPEQKKRTAVAARREAADEQVWLRASSIKRRLSPHGWVMVQVETTAREGLSPTGGVFLGLGTPLIIGGVAVMAAGGGDNAGASLGFGAIFLGAGLVHAVIGGVLIAVGRARAWQEIGPRQRGWSYIPVGGDSAHRLE